MHIYNVTLLLKDIYHPLHQYPNYDSNGFVGIKVLFGNTSLQTESCVIVIRTF